MTFNKLKVQGGKWGEKEKKPHQVRKLTRGDDHTDEGDQNGGGDGNEVCHSIRIATRILARLLIEVHSSVPFKSDQFGEGTEVPKCTWRQLPAKGPVPDLEAIDGDDPLLTIPPPQYNLMLAVFCNMLYIFVVVLLITYGIFQIWRHLWTGFLIIYPR